MEELSVTKELYKKLTTEGKNLTFYIVVNKAKTLNKS
jgi:hypothetical protein